MRPEQSFAVLESFAKWLFSIAGTVGALGVGFGVSGANHLHGAGLTLYTAAVACVAAALASAALSQLPRMLNYNPNSPDSMHGAIDQVIRKKQRILALAGLLLALGLLLAGIAPAVQ